MMRKFKTYTTEEIAELGDAFYNTTVWKHKRAEILRRDHHECQRCKTVHHRLTRATTVHHIKHLDERPDLALVDSNLMSVCYACHNEEHPEKAWKEKENKWDDEKW